jgi:hypothetical protein
MDLGIDFSLIIYILVGALVGLGVPYYFLQSGKFYAGVGFLLAALATLIFFGLRWFNGLRLDTTFFGATSTTQSWPPQINYCPDFLSLKQIGANYYCVDAMGVSKFPRFTESSAVDTSRPGNYLPLTQTNTATLYQPLLMASGLRWEGVYDGISAANIKPPFPAF